MPPASVHPGKSENAPHIANPPIDAMPEIRNPMPTIVATVTRAIPGHARQMMPRISRIAPCPMSDHLTLVR